MQSYFQFYTDKRLPKVPGEILAEKFVDVEKPDDISQYSDDPKY